MRTIVFLTLLNLIALSTFCQNSVSSVARQNEEFTPYYEMAAAGSKVLYLPMDYGLTKGITGCISR